MESADSYKPVDKEALRTFKHDVKNQLSNINLALDQLRYELTEANDDSQFYMDTIATSCARINEMLKTIG